MSIESENHETFTCTKSIKKIWKNITVEPILFLYILPLMMEILTTENLSLEKACKIELKYNKTVCDAMIIRDRKNYEENQEIEVQKLVSKMFALRSTLSCIFPFILMMFLGSWSDRNARRKPIILLPIVGDLIASMNMISCSYFFSEVPLLTTTLIEAIPHALGGTLPCVFLGIYSYATGMSKDDQKTTRIGTIAILQTIAMASGIAIAGWLIKPLTLIWMYVLICSLMIGGLLYVSIFINDGPVLVSPRKNFQKDLLDFGHVKNTFKICFKSGPNNRMFRMILVMIISFIDTGTSYAETSLYYLYARIKFGWDERDYGTFNAALFVIQSIGSFSALAIFSKMLKLHDAHLGVIALISKICGALVYAFAPNGTIFYMGLVVDIFMGLSHIALRSLVSKIVKTNELGQAYAVYAMCLLISPLIFVPPYTAIYNRMLNIFPGTYYLVSCGFHLLNIILYSIFYKMDKGVRSRRSEKEREKNENLERMLNPSSEAHQMTEVR